MIYDIAIIGAGPAGLYAAKELSRQGKAVLLFEKDRVGGVSTHEGCIPAKSLLYTASIWDEINTIDKFGIHVNGRLNFDYKEIIARKDRISKAIHTRIQQQIEDSKITFIKAFAQLNGEDADGIKILADGKTYKAKKVLLTGGSKNFVPPIEGIDTSGYLEARTVMQLDEVPKSMTVIGGGVLGVEFASLFATFGTKVDVVERGDEILASNDKELAHLLRIELEKKGITFHLNATVNKVDGKTVFITEEGGNRKITNDEILLATGRTPLVDNLNLNSLDIKLTNRGAVAVDKTMKTSHPHVYACGDIVGGAMLVHAAFLEADVAMADILGKTHILDYNLVPGVVYTNPEMSFVGAMERQLLAKEIPYHIIRIPLGRSDRYVQQNDIDAEGLLKIILGEDDKILGVHILGNTSSEYITIASIAIAEGWTREKLKKVVFPYPTIARILRDAL